MQGQSNTLKLNFLHQRQVYQCNNKQILARTYNKEVIVQLDSSIKLKSRWNCGDKLQVWSQHNLDIKVLIGKEDEFWVFWGNENIASLNLGFVTTDVGDFSFA